MVRARKMVETPGHPNPDGRSRHPGSRSAARAQKFAVLALLCLGGTGAGAGDGATLYRDRQCHTCHGEDGESPALPLYPRLAGQGAEYLYRQAIDIRDGRRTNGLSAAMRATMARVADEDLRLIAEWLAGR